MSETDIPTGEESLPKLTIIPRLQWEDLRPLNPSRMTLPVNRIRLSNSGGKSCDSLESCTKRLRKMHWNHMYHWGHQDIGFNFMVAADGTMYEGRGWVSEPERIDTFHDIMVANCLDIGFIGRFRKELPPVAMENAVYQFIKEGVETNHIDPNYTLVRFKLGDKVMRDEEQRKEAELEREKIKKRLRKKKYRMCRKLDISWVYCRGKDV